MTNFLFSTLSVENGILALFLNLTETICMQLTFKMYTRKTLFRTNWFKVTSLSSSKRSRNNLGKYILLIKKIFCFIDFKKRIDYLSNVLLLSSDLYWKEFYFWKFTTNLTVWAEVEILIALRLTIPLTSFIFDIKSIKILNFLKNCGTQITNIWHLNNNHANTLFIHIHHWFIIILMPLRKKRI